MHNSSALVGGNIFEKCLYRHESIYLNNNTLLFSKKKENRRLSVTRLAPCEATVGDKVEAGFLAGNEISLRMWAISTRHGRRERERKVKGRETRSQNG